MNLNEVYNFEYKQFEENTQNGHTRVNCLTCLYNNKNQIKKMKTLIYTNKDRFKGFILYNLKEFKVKYL